MGDATTYCPSSGARFLTRDPIEALTRSAYGYVGNNPLNATDPTGLSECGQWSLGGLVDCASKADPEEVVEVVNTVSGVVAAGAGICTAAGAVSIIGAPIAAGCATVGAGALTVNLGTGFALMATGNKSAGSYAVDVALAGTGGVARSGAQASGRFAHPVTGQFLTRDPLESVTREPYGYAGNNPTNATDPAGLDSGYHDCGTGWKWNGDTCIMIGSTTPAVLTGPVEVPEPDPVQPGSNCESQICKVGASITGRLSYAPSNELVQNPTANGVSGYIGGLIITRPVPPMLSWVITAFDFLFRGLLASDPNADGYVGTFAYNCSPEGVPNWPQQ